MAGFYFVRCAARHNAIDLGHCCHREWCVKSDIRAIMFMLGSSHGATASLALHQFMDPNLVYVMCVMRIAWPKPFGREPDSTFPELLTWLPRH